MAYQGPPSYRQPGAPPDYQYVQSHNYPTGPGAEVPLRHAYGQPYSAAYDHPAGHVSVPSAFERYPESGPGAEVPLKYDYGQGKPGYDHSQVPVHVAVPNAFERYSDTAPGAAVPLKQDYGQGYTPSYGPPQAIHVAVPNAFDRNAEPGPFVPSASQRQPSPFATDFTDHPTRESTHGMNYSYSSSFSDKAIRRAFIRKVYLILTSQLCVTIGFIALFIFVEPVNTWVRTDGLWCYIVAYVTFMITYFVLICFPSVRRNSPGNFICLAVFTVAFSFLTATISSFHDTKIVLLAAGITGAVCLAITLFAVQTKIDFTLCSGLLFALMMVLFFFGIACMITYYCWGYNHILDTVYAGLGALVFALVLVYNTQMIVGGRKHELSPEEYIYGALQLYLDVVYIFLFILSLMGRKK